MVYCKLHYYYILHPNLIFGFPAFQGSFVQEKAFGFILARKEPHRNGVALKPSRGIMQFKLLMIVRMDGLNGTILINVKLGILNASFMSYAA